jgi:hypothetical protein
MSRTASTTSKKIGRNGNSLDWRMRRMITEVDFESNMPYISREWDEELGRWHYDRQLWVAWMMLGGSNLAPFEEVKARIRGLVSNHRSFLGDSERAGKTRAPKRIIAVGPAFDHGISQTLSTTNPD